MVFEPTVVSTQYQFLSISLFQFSRSFLTHHLSSFTLSLVFSQSQKDPGFRFSHLLIQFSFSFRLSHLLIQLYIVVTAFQLEVETEKRFFLSSIFSIFFMVILAFLAVFSSSFTFSLYCFPSFSIFISKIGLPLA